ncbi:MAG: cytochrome c peroxidase [Planctomycetota bacterium]
MSGLSRLLVAILGISAVPLGAFGQSRPALPATNFDYFKYAVTDLPPHYTGPIGVAEADNTPADNPITNAGATLGRVLFYDKRLSHNNTVACASCHTQETGFADPRRFSQGVDGFTGRHSMALTNASYYENGKFFWDERAETLEDQILQPIQDPIEMGFDLPSLETRLSETDFYPELFNQAFGTPDVTSDRIAKSVAQFVRSMVSYNARFDEIFGGTENPDLSLLTPQELHGFQIYNSTAGRCANCHGTTGHISDDVHNIGLDAVDTDPGAGDGKFKSPSLRNVEVRGRFMHDGRFASLEEVMEFYATGVNQSNPNLDSILVDFEPNFTTEEQEALIAFLNTFTDWDFLTDPRFSDPFEYNCDFNDDNLCNVDDLNQLLAEGPIRDGVPVDGTNAMFDMNGDGTLDNVDRDLWLFEAGQANGLREAYLLGDANLDGLVDVSDFNRWNLGKFTTSTDWDTGDFNGDGLVDVSDFNIWNLKKFTAATDAVPEPAGLLTLLLGCSLLVMIRRTRMA